MLKAAKKPPLMKSKKYPIDRDSTFSYGNSSRPSDNMRDVMCHNFERDWIAAAEIYKASKTPPPPNRRFETNASIKRNLALQKRFDLTSNTGSGSGKGSFSPRNGIIPPMKRKPYHLP
jgi:hypothetical protein